MSDVYSSPLGSIINGDTFKFPELINSNFAGLSGAYNVLLDATLVNMSASDLTVNFRIGHEVAHRLIAIDSLPVRSARNFAGLVYALIWYFLSIIAEFRLDFNGIKIQDIKKFNGIAMKEAVVPLEAILNSILNYQSLLDTAMGSIQIVYELAAIELGVRLLQDSIDKEKLKSIEEVLISTVAKQMVPALIRNDPTYWLEKRLEKEGAKERDKEELIAKLIIELNDIERNGICIPCYLINNKLKPNELKDYEKLFVDLYNNYKEAVSSTDIKKRLRFTNAGFGTCVAIHRDDQGNLTLCTAGDPDKRWIRGHISTKQQNYIPESGDAWRIAQYAEFVLRWIPEIYRMPYHMMNSLDFILFQEHAYKSSIEEYGEIGKDVGFREFIIPGLQKVYSPSFLTIVIDNKPQLLVNEKIVEIGNKQFGLKNDWWKTLLLLETLRWSLKNGTPAVCPLLNLDFDCSKECPIRINLDFLSAHSEMVAEKFCNN